MVSPANKKRMHSVMATTNLPTPPPLKISAHLNKNLDSRMVQDLNRQVSIQMSVIADLRHKLSLIRDISNDSNIVNKKEMNSEVDRIKNKSTIESNISNDDIANKTIVTTDKDAKKIVHININ